MAFPVFLAPVIEYLAVQAPREMGKQEAISDVIRLTQKHLSPLLKQIQFSKKRRVGSSKRKNSPLMVVFDADENLEPSRAECAFIWKTNKNSNLTTIPGSEGDWGLFVVSISLPN